MNLNKECIETLNKELQDKVSKLIEANDADSVKSEMAEVLLVLDAIQEYYGIEYPQVLAVKAMKASK